MSDIEPYREALRECGKRYMNMIYDDVTREFQYDDYATHPLVILDNFIAEFQGELYTAPLMKMNRWLGYIQGCLIERGYTTVEAERDFTRPLFRPLDFPE